MSTTNQVAGDIQTPLPDTSAWMAGIVAVFAPLAIRTYRRRTWRADVHQALVTTWSQGPDECRHAGSQGTDDVDSGGNGEV
jgi:hypothetical protein